VEAPVPGVLSVSRLRTPAVYWVTDCPALLDGDQLLVSIFSLAEIVVKCAAVFTS
jgi:hypothetical protein